MPRKPIRSQTLKADEPEAIYALYKKKAVFPLKSCQCYLFSPWKVFQMLLGSGKKKQFFSRFLYPGIAGSVPGPNESIMGASTKIPVLFTEQKDLNPCSPSPSLSWLHLMCRTHRLGYFLSLAQKLQILAKFLISNSLPYMFQKTKKCMSLV